MASSIYNMEAIRKILVCNFAGVHCSCTCFLFFVCFNRKCLRSWGDLGVTYKRIIKVSWIFSDFSFWGESVNRNSIIMIGKGYHNVINIFSNFLYQYREDLWRRENPNSPEFICYHRSFAKDQYRQSILIFGKGPIIADELGGI